jgi:hypothetical protein
MEIVVERVLEEREETRVWVASACSAAIVIWSGPSPTVSGRYYIELLLETVLELGKDLVVSTESPGLNIVDEIQS